MDNDEALSTAARRFSCVSRQDSAIAGTSHALHEAQCSPETPSSWNEALAILAHEIRGRLNGLTITTESLRRRTRDGTRELPREWLLERFDRQSRYLKRLQQVLDMVLSAYRGASGDLIPTRESADLCDVVRDALGVESEALKSAHCDYVLDTPEHVFGSWDRFQLELAVANLVNNAAKYGAGHPIEIKIFTEEDTAHVAIQDHGIGIRPEEIPRLFYRFARLESSAGSSGIGLGLWFAKCVALAHGGDVDARSSEGGACFTLTVPLTAT